MTKKVYQLEEVDQKQYQVTAEVGCADEGAQRTHDLQKGRIKKP